MSVVPPPGSLSVGGERSETHPADAQRAPSIPTSPPLPEQYGENRLILLVRDPATLFASWEVTPQTMAQARTVSDAPLCLRLVELAGGGNSVLSHEVGVGETGSRYLVHDRPGSIFRAEIGVGWGSEFLVLLQSLPVRTPTGRESERIDAAWTTIDEVLERSRHGQYRGGGSVFL